MKSKVVKNQRDYLKRERSLRLLRSGDGETRVEITTNNCKLFILLNAEERAQVRDFLKDWSANEETGHVD